MEHCSTQTGCGAHMGMRMGMERSMCDHPHISSLIPVPCPYLTPFVAYKFNWLHIRKIQLYEDREEERNTFFKKTLKNPLKLIPLISKKLLLNLYSKFKNYFSCKCYDDFETLLC